MPAPRRRRVEADGASRPAKGERRRALVAAAKRLFAEQGYSLTTLDQIAKAAGVTPAQAARSFRDKPAYLRAILGDLLTRAFPPRGEAPGDALGQLHAAVDRLLGEARLEMQVLARALAEPGLDEASAGALQAGLIELLEALTRVMQQGQQAGVLRRSPDARTAAAEVFRAVLGYLLVQPHFSPEGEPPADLSAAALDGVLHGLLKTDI
jgi:AcrR family transcriptional regulator